MKQDLAPNYEPQAVEAKWYKKWEEGKLFASRPDARQPYTVVIPPPNVTGILHMGHMLNNTIQDILVRRARMQGRNAVWVPGTDHASIATEAKVVKKLADQGIRKLDLTREQFLEHAWDWTHTHGGIILKQLRKLGASCDWDREAFTMDATRSASVNKVFVDLYRKGLIYRGKRMVNWDPKAQTALSNEEVIYQEEQSHLYNLRYYVADDKPVVVEEGNVVHRDAEGRYYAVVATTRPETIMGDTAMCINPKDPKNTWLKGHSVIVPLVGREVPVIEDRYVDIEFGTGCLKVTPAHDVNDFMLGKTHSLETIDIFNPDGTISAESPLYVGMDRMDVREQIVKDLREAGLMERIEDYTNKVGFSERTKVPVEPRLCNQWFLSMKHFADIALPPVLDGRIKFHPTKYVNTYRQWLENIQDWCISRQLWWGHRIPAYYLSLEGAETEEFVVAETPEEALQLAREKTGNAKLQMSDLRHDEDALDTWFSSWLWPISLFDGINRPGNEEIKYYYPTADLVTAPDIIFFWVARMIMAGMEYEGDVPFRNVYFTGIVRDKLGRKMSKQLGNSPDPLDLIDRYGADGVRMGMMLSAPAGNDILFDDKLCEQGRNFNNKIWNSFRLLQGWEMDATLPQPEASKEAAKWFASELNRAVAEIDDLFGKYRISEALMAVYRLFRDEFSSWYLEMLKPAYQHPVDAVTYAQAIDFFDALLRMLHPFMPFITEELWQHLKERAEGESIMLARQPQAGPVDEKLLADVDVVKQIINGIRGVRAAKNIPSKDVLSLQIVGDWTTPYTALIEKLGNVDSVTNVAGKDPAAATFMVDTTTFCVPLKDAVDVEAELAKLRKDLEYQEGFLKSVEKKLSNERFVSKAPQAVVDAERRKMADATDKIATLRAAIAALGN